MVFRPSKAVHQRAMPKGSIAVQELHHTQCCGAVVSAEGVLAVQQLNNAWSCDAVVGTEGVPGHADR